MGSVADFNVFLCWEEPCIKVLLKNICNEAGSHLGDWQTDSARHTGRGELLEGRGQVHGISQRNSPGSGERSSLTTSLAATEANSKAVGPGNLLEGATTTPLSFLAKYMPCRLYHRRPDQCPASLWRMKAMGVREEMERAEMVGGIDVKSLLQCLQPFLHRGTEKIIVFS